MVGRTRSIHKKEVIENLQRLIFGTREAHAKTSDQKIRRVPQCRRPERFVRANLCQDKASAGRDLSVIGGRGEVF